MTDHNDGNWHGWNGGECPVHPKSVVEAVWHDPLRSTAGVTGPCPAKVENEPTLAWSHVVKFRVVKVHREPREWWVRVDQYGSAAFSSPNLGALPPGTDMTGVIKVREVIE